MSTYFIEALASLDDTNSEARRLWNSYVNDPRFINSWVEDKEISPEFEELWTARAIKSRMQR